MENSNLPMKVNNNFILTIENKRQIKRVIAGFKRTGKIALNGLVAVAGLGVSALTRSNRCYAWNVHFGSSND